MAQSLFTSQTPAGTNNSDGTPGIATGTSMVFAVAGSITHVRFYATTTVSGTYTVNVWEVTGDDASVQTGTLLATKVMGGSPTAGAWNAVALDTPVTVTPLTKMYRVAVHSSAGRYVNTSNFAPFVFGSGGLTNGDIWAPHNGDDPVGLGTVGQGVFRISATSTIYPFTSFNTSCYFADVIFEEDSGTTPVSGSIDLRWQVRNTVSGTSDLRWQVRNTVSGTSDLRWQVKNTVTGSIDFRWAVKAIVSGAMDLRWAVRNVVSGALDARWAVLQSVSGSLDLRWSQREVVTGSLDLRWASGGSVSGSIEFPWRVANTVSGTLDLRWAVTSQISGSLDLRWRSYARALGTIQFLWVVEGSGIPIPTTIRAYLTERIVADLRQADVVADLRER